MPLLETLNSKYGVGPVCHELDIAPSTYYWHRTRQEHPDKRSQRSRDDEQLKHEIQRVYDENKSVYGARKVWHQLLRDGFSVARCTVERLMKIMGLAGVLRGKKVRIRKRSRYGGMRVVTTIPRDKAKNFAASLTTLLSGNYSESKIDMVEILNRKLKGWAVFYQFVDFKAKVFSYIDRVVFWKMAHWLARKYRKGIAYLMRWWCKSPKPGQSKTWVLFGKTNHGKLNGEVLYRLAGQGKKLFRWRLPEDNPYLRTEARNTYTSRYPEVAMALASV